MTAPRKYLSEFGLNINANGFVVLTQDQLGDFEAVARSTMGEDFSPHIYLICRKPRIYLDPKSFQVDGDVIRFTLYKQVQYDRFALPIALRNELGTDNLTLRSNYPYTEFWIDSADGKELLHATVTAWLADVGAYPDELNLEVLYVGQSYGKDGNRNAIKRLQSHDTLQGIYAEAMRLSPDQEVWLVLATFERYLLGSFDGISKNYQASEEEDSAHVHDVIHNQITEQQEVNFTEAALIRYFRPEYNIIFKDSFPSPGHSTYDQCYNVDLNLLCVELQTESISTKLWSQAVEPKWVHFAKFNLHNEAERRAMFELL